MGITVVFGPSPINCGVIPPGTNTTATVKCTDLSAPANVTASISGDTSGGALKVSSVISIVTKIELQFPDPGELPPGSKPIPIRVEVPVQVGESNGITPLAVEAGQYVEVVVEFAPIFEITPDTCAATLNIEGNNWNPIAIPITATVAEISVTIPSISVTQGESTTVDVSVICGTGPETTVNLSLSNDFVTGPNVTPSISPHSFDLGKGQTSTPKLTVAAGSTLVVGTYSWLLIMSAYGGAYVFSTIFSIEVKAPVVLGTLSISHLPADLLIGEVNTVTINATDTKSGKTIDGLKVIVASIFSGTTPESPHTDGVTGTALKYAVNISDSTAIALVLGAPNYQNNQLTIPLAYPPLKVWYTGGSGSWTIYGSGFIGDEVEITVDSEGLDHPGPYKGNIATGIKMTADCINPGQYWTIQVQGLTITSQKVTTNVSC